MKLYTPRKDKKKADDTTYAYDANNRLTQSVNNGSTTNYSYDNNGNLLKTTKGSSVTAYTYNGYNQLTDVAMPNGNWTSNEYDGLGMRIAETETGTRNEFTLDGQNVIAEKVGDSAETRYIRGLGLVATKGSTGTMAYYLHNAHGDVTNLVDSTGGVKNSYSYDAFGNALTCTETVSNRFMYAGEQFDKVTGEYYLRARYYEPVVGRFTQEDTYKGDGLNLYTYVANNPINMVDPSGHCKTSSEAIIDEDKIPTGNKKVDVDSLLSNDLRSDEVEKFIRNCNYIIDQCKDILEKVDSIYKGINQALISIYENGGFGSELSIEDVWIDPSEDETYQKAFEMFINYTSLKATAERILPELKINERITDTATASSGGMKIVKGIEEVGAAIGSLGKLGKVDEAAIKDATIGKYVDPWISKDTFSFITKKFNKDAAHDFVKAMQEGFVGPKAEEGIKKLASAKKKNGITYTHEIKVTEGQMKNYRIYGYYSMERGRYIFDWFGPAMHK